MTTTNNKLLRGTVAPNQPMAPPEYDQRFHEQFSNVLRLYFNQLDNLTNAITSDYGGSGLRFPYGAFQDTTTQTTTANTAKVITLNTTDYASGTSLVGGSKITANVSGLYNFQFSVQISSLENAPTDTSIWLRKNGVDIVGSTGLIGLLARKSPSDPSHDIKGWNYFISMEANDFVQMYWSSTSSNVSIDQYPASVSPTRPSTASVVATLSFVSSI
jgi:hypothetical protein